MAVPNEHDCSQPGLAHVDAASAKKRLAAWRRQLAAVYAQKPESGGRELPIALPYDPVEILTLPLRCIREALNDFPAEFFDSHLDVISRRLQALRPGESYTAATRGAPQPCDDALRHHGTCWTALLGIAWGGFRKYPGSMSWNCGLHKPYPEHRLGLSARSPELAGALRRGRCI